MFYKTLCLFLLLCLSLSRPACWRVSPSVWCPAAEDGRTADKSQCGEAEGEKALERGTKARRPSPSLPLLVVNTNTSCPALHKITIDKHPPLTHTHMPVVEDWWWRRVTEFSMSSAASSSSAGNKRGTLCWSLCATLSLCECVRGLGWMSTTWHRAPLCIRACGNRNSNKHTGPVQEKGISGDWRPPSLNNDDLIS